MLIVPHHHLMITHQRLLESIRYNPENGYFIWPNGDIAGTERNDGYCQINILGKIYLAHRLAWFYVTGEWPIGKLDHQDNDRLNNRWENLRLATNGQNAWNSKLSTKNRSGHKGICWHSGRGKWLGVIRKEGRVVFYKQSHNLQELVTEIQEARRSQHQNFHNHG